MAEEMIGTVMDFFAKPVVAGIDLMGTLKTGDSIHIVGHTTDMQLNVGSMQINNANVNEAKPRDYIGIKGRDRVRRGDKVYKIVA